MQLDNSPFEFDAMRSHDPAHGYFQQVVGKEDEKVGGMNGTKMQTRGRAVSLQDRNQVFSFPIDGTNVINKTPFPTMRPRSWHEAILATRLRLFRAQEIIPDNNAAVRIWNAQKALERLDGTSGVGEGGDLLRRIYHLKSSTTARTHANDHAKIPETPPRRINRDHNDEISAYDATPTPKFPSDDARISAGSLSPLGTVLVTPTAWGDPSTAGGIQEMERGRGTAGASRDGVQFNDGEAGMIGTVPQQTATGTEPRKQSCSKSSILTTFDDSASVVLDFTRFQKPVARVIEYEQGPVNTPIATSLAVDDPFLQPLPTSGTLEIFDTNANLSGLSSQGASLQPRFISSPIDSIGRNAAAIPIAMIPVKDIDQLSTHALDRSPSLHDPSPKRRSRLMLKARPSMERLSRAFEEGFAKTLRVFGRKPADQKLALLANIETYREGNPRTPMKKDPIRNLARSFSSTMLSPRPAKRDSMDSGFSWSPKTWRRTPGPPANNTPPSPALDSPKTLRRRPRLPSFRLSTFSQLLPKESVNTTHSSASCSGRKRSDSEASWGNATSEKVQDVALEKPVHFSVSSRIRKISHSKDHHGVVRKSTLRLLKHGSAWGAMKRASRKRPAHQGFQVSVSTSSLSESMSDSSVPRYATQELPYQPEGNMNRQNARMEALAILEGRARKPR